MQMIYTSLEVAEILRCTQGQVEEMLRSGDLPGIKFGRSWIIPSDALSQRLTEIALSQAVSRRSRAQLQPSQVVTLHEASGRGRRRKEPPKLPVLTACEMLRCQR